MKAVSMIKFIPVVVVFTVMLGLQGCVHKIVTVPVKAAYKVTKGVAKGTVKVVKAVIPGDSDDKKKD